MTGRVAAGVRAGTELNPGRPNGAVAMTSLDMHGLFHWFSTHEILLAVLITAAVALLLVCCLGCTNCPCSKEDELFKRREV